MIINGQMKTHNLYKKWIDEHRDEPTKEDNFLAAFNNEMTKDPKSAFFDVPQFYYLLADLYGAGTDTTLTTLRWFILLMAAHPVEQVRQIKFV